MSRNTAFDALLALGQALTPPGGGAWGDTGRRWKDYSTAQLPVLWQIEKDTDYTSANHGQLTKRKAQVFWAVAHNVGADQAAVPASTTADFLDAVDARFINPNIGPITLNGSCYACYINGTVQRFGGDADGIELIIIPLVVEFP